MSTVLLLVELTPGSGEIVAELLRERPLIELSGSPLSRHLVYSSEDALVVLLEGVGAEQAASALVEGEPTVLAPYLAAAPRRLDAVFSWCWPQAPAA